MSKQNPDTLDYIAHGLYVVGDLLALLAAVALLPLWGPFWLIGRIGAKYGIPSEEADPPEEYPL